MIPLFLMTIFLMRMNLIKKNLQDYDVAEYYENYHFLDERITSRSTKAGEIKREIICSLLWNKKVLRTNLANFWKDVPRICNFINYFPKLWFYSSGFTYKQINNLITTLKYTVWFTTLNSTSSALPCTTWQGYIEHVGSNETHICAQSYCEICRSEIIIMWLRNITSVLNHSTLEFRDFSKRAPGSWSYVRSTEHYPMRTRLAPRVIPEISHTFVIVKCWSVRLFRYQYLFCTFLYIL